MEGLAEALGIDLGDPTTQAFLKMHRERQNLMDNLVQIRQSRNLRQKDVAEMLGVSRVAVSRMEGEARDPRLSTLIRYAEAVGAVINLSAVRVEQSPAYMETRLQKMRSQRNSMAHNGSWGHTSVSVANLKPVRQNRDFILAA